VFHERTKHTDAWTKKVASLSFTPSSKQVADFSPKVFFLILSGMLGMIDIYAPG